MKQKITAAISCEEMGICHCSILFCGAEMFVHARNHLDRWSVHAVENDHRGT